MVNETVREYESSKGNYYGGDFQFRGENIFCDGLHKHTRLEQVKENKMGGTQY